MLNDVLMRHSKKFSSKRSIGMTCMFRLRLREMSCGTKNIYLGSRGMYLRNHNLLSVYFGGCKRHVLFWDIVYTMSTLHMRSYNAFMLCHHHAGGRKEVVPPGTLYIGF